jgi:hypothetical protein
MRRCGICSEVYWPEGRDPLGVCEWCAPNLSAMQATYVHPEVPYVDEDLAQRLLLEQALETERPRRWPWD